MATRKSTTGPIRRTGRVRNGDAVRITAVMTASGTVG